MENKTMKTYRVLIPASFDFYIVAKSAQEAAREGFAWAERHTSATLWLYPESAAELEVEQQSV